MTNKERIELYRTQRDAAEALCQHARADARQANIRADHMEHRIKELEAALASIEAREAVDADPQLDAYRRGVEDGIERVRRSAATMIGIGGPIIQNTDTLKACDRAAVSFRAERS